MKIPLSLSVYEHAARCLGKTPGEVSRDEELVYQAHWRLCEQPYRQAIAGYTAQEEALADIPASQTLLSKGQGKGNGLAQIGHNDSSCRPLTEWIPR